MAIPVPEPFRQKLLRAGKVLNALALVAPEWSGRLAFRMFCTPRRLPLREKDQGFLSSAVHHTLITEGLSIRWYSWESKQGTDAPTILFLHGWESNAARWNAYVKTAVKSGYRVAALDAPASGNSTGKQLNVLLYSRIIQTFIAEHGAPFAMVGHSLGGAAAVMSLAILQADRPKKLVLLASFAESTRVLRGFAGMIGASDAVLQSIFKYIERRSGMPVAEYSVKKKAAELSDVAGLVLHDRDDEVAPVEEGREIAASWGCSFIETTGFGHRMQDKSVVNVVMAFLASAENSVPAPDEE